MFLILIIMWLISIRTHFLYGHTAKQMKGNNFNIMNLLMQSVGRPTAYPQDRIIRFEDRLEKELKLGIITSRSQLYCERNFVKITGAPHWFSFRWPRVNTQRDFMLAMRVRCETPGTRAFNLVIAAFGPKPQKTKAIAKKMLAKVMLQNLVANFRRNS